MRETVAVISGIIIFASAIPYIIDIIKGKTKPNVVSWFTWTLIAAIGTGAAWSEGAITSAILSGADTVGILIITLLALRFGLRHYTLFDVACQVVALIGLGLWFITSEAWVALAIAVAVDVVALLPTLRHSWRKPHEETWSTFALSAFAAALVVVTVPELSFVALAYPVYLVLGNAAPTAVILYRRRVLGAADGAS